MSVVILQSDVVIFRDPLGGTKANQYRWWAERGMIHSENQTTGEYKSQTVREVLIHLKGLNDFVGNSRLDNEGVQPDIRAKYQEYIAQMIALCKKAQGQGMPDDPNHTKQLADKIKADRQSRFVVLPGLAGSF